MKNPTGFPIAIAALVYVMYGYIYNLVTGEPPTPNLILLGLMLAGAWTEVIIGEMRNRRAARANAEARRREQRVASVERVALSQTIARLVQACVDGREPQGVDTAAYLVALASRPNMPQNGNPHTTASIAARHLVWQAVLPSSPVLTPAEVRLTVKSLAACERAYAIAPAHLQQRMLPLLSWWRDHLGAQSPDVATAEWRDRIVSDYFAAIADEPKPALLLPTGTPGKLRAVTLDAYGTRT